MGIVSRVKTRPISGLLKRCVSVPDPRNHRQVTVGRFGIPTIILNIIDGVDVNDYVTFSGDAIGCRDTSDYRLVVEDIVTDPVRLQVEADRTLHPRGEYFRNTEGFSTSEFIRDHIANDLGWNECPHESA